MSETTRELLARARNPLDPARKAADIERLLASGADVNASGHRGATPLLLTCANGTAAALDVLVAAGASLTARDDAGDGAVQYATRYLGPRADIAESLREERYVILQRLLTLGLDLGAADARGRAPLELAAANLDRHAIDLLSSSAAPRDVDAAIRAAVEHGNLDTVRALLEHGPTIDDALIARAVEGHHAAIAAELRRARGQADPAAADPLTALSQLAERLGAEAASSAEASGDLDHYQAEDDLDPHDLVSEYWHGRYRRLVVEAMSVLPSAARQQLPPDDALLDQLFERYAEAYRRA